MYHSVTQTVASDGPLETGGENTRVQVHERRIAADGDGLTLRVREWPGDGSPVLLAHGLASNSRIWDDVAGRLAERHHVVALDQRGHGESDRPTDADFGFPRMVADLRAVADALG